MDLHQRTVRVGLMVILFAAVIRLSSMIPLLIPAEPDLSTDIPEETGQNVRFSPSYGTFFPKFVESPPPFTLEPEIPAFADAKAVEIQYSVSTRPDTDDLIRQPLTWNLRASDPTVLILHTHATESYTKQGQLYQETAAYRTLDEQYNMLSIGDAVAEVLIRQGISVIHDRTLHDYPSYNGSYTQARKTIRDYLDRYPTIQLILDLHRDASGEHTKQLRTQAGEADCAQLMVVIGANHKDYQDNLSLGLKLHAQLESGSPGITRPLQLRGSRFNQDLLPGALLIEVGAAGNTHQEALNAARQLALAIIALAGGSR